MTKTSGDLWPSVRVYNPDGTPLCDATNTTTAEVSCTLTSSGAHTILVGDGFDGTGTGDYNLYHQRTNSPGNATLISFGHTVSGTIAGAATLNTYTFSGNSGDQIIVRMTKTSGDLWPSVRVYNPDGTPLCDATNTTTAEVSCTLTSSGAHTILVGDGFDGTGTGDYNLYLQRTNSPGNATLISFGHTVSGTIAGAATLNTYTFSGNSGDQIIVRMTKTSGDLWPSVRVYNPDGTPLCDATNTTTAEVSCTLTSLGAHTILVGDGFDGTGTGDYNLYLGCVSAHCGAAPVGGIAEAPEAAVGHGGTSGPRFPVLAGLAAGAVFLLAWGTLYVRRRYSVGRR